MEAGTRVPVRRGTSRFRATARSLERAALEASAAAVRDVVQVLSA